MSAPMRYVSTRGGVAPCAASEAILGGLAGDGGLYVPAAPVQFDAAGVAPDADLPTVAKAFLAPFFAGDPLAAHLDAICDEAFDFPVPLVSVERRLGLLELFHGPTAAFKDFGARFLAACLARSEAAAGEGSPLTILVATSGDTGGAVAAAFHGRAGMAVDVFFPDGMVSPRQAQQLTCWGDNVRAFRVQGRFDDCQRLVKAAFRDTDLAARRRFSSANSINLGRLLPQAAYYVWASLTHRARHGRSPSFVVPTGNLGNGLACVWARRAGAPIDAIHFVTNANRSVVDFLQGEAFAPRTSIETLANAMDVGNPSNLERLRAAYPDDELRRRFTASSVSDAQIERCIRDAHRERGLILCPHTATALHAWQTMDASRRDAHDWVLVATAHPAKFDTVVEPLIGTTVDVPPALARLLALPSHAIALRPELDALREHY